MKITIFTLGFLLLTNFSFSQIKKKELNGEWYSDNDFGQYYKNDTIRFTNQIKNFNQEKRDCEQIKWEKENRTFKLIEVNICKARAKVSKGFLTQKIKLRKTDFGQTIEYYQDKNLIDKFRIIELDKNLKSELKLMRFDKLSDQKVYKYVDSLVFKVLKYNPKKKEEIYAGKVYSDSVWITIGGDHINKSPEPLIVLNNRPLKNRELLKDLLLVETYDITYLFREQATKIYGWQAINGVIIMQTSEKRLKKIWKK